MFLSDPLSPNPVIPPGVDLDSFSPPLEDWSAPAVAEELSRFLRHPEKPIILTMARPDERKNLGKLVEVYGRSPQLQELANVVLVMGTRDDLRELPKPQQHVINNVLYLIDKFDLYGKIAYPKQHAPTDIADLYRLATFQRGVFINPALTEPFGLTLLEAGATGLPIIATHDGGPRDIIANCENGLLVDPLDDVAIEKALLRALTEPEQWERWSLNGIAGTRKHYAWSNHGGKKSRASRSGLKQQRLACRKYTTASMLGTEQPNRAAVFGCAVVSNGSGLVDDEPMDWHSRPTSR